MMNVRKALGKIVLLLILMLSVITSDVNVSATGGVFRVQHKFAGKKPSLSHLIDHDTQRHQRILHSVQLPLNDTNDADGTGLYYTKVKIGTPSKEYYVSIDTTLDFMWVGCASCNTCPRTSGIGVGLTLYNSSDSSTSRHVFCKEACCPEKNCVAGSPCTYGLFTSLNEVVNGHYVKDVMEYERVLGNYTTSTEKSQVLFGCTTGRVRTLSAIAVDGALGFAEGPRSIISQFAATGASKKKFFHCIDHSSGGGIFAIGDLAWPVVQTTPIANPRTSYSVKMMSVMVRGSPLSFPENVFSAKNMTETFIDSGLSFGYLPSFMYKSVRSAIFQDHENVEVETRLDDEGKKSECFKYKGSLDDFPNVTLRFNGSLELVVTPHKYFTELKKDDTYCLVWRVLGGEDEGGPALVGAPFLSDMVVLYDLENQVIGWTNHDCKKNVLVRDEQSKEIFEVGGQKSLLAQSREMGRIVVSLLLLSAIFVTIF